MSGAGRQTVLKLALPAAAVAMLYVYGHARGVSLELAATRKAIADARAAAPSPAEVAREAAKAADLPGTVETLRRRRDALNAPGAGAPLAGRIADAAWLTQLFVDRNLVLVEEEMVPADSAIGTLPPGFRAAAPGAGVSLRTLRFTGRYLDVLTAMESLAVSGRRICPVSVKLESSVDGGRLVWEVRLWM